MRYHRLPVLLGLVALLSLTGCMGETTAKATPPPAPTHTISPTGTRAKNEAKKLEDAARGVGRASERAVDDVGRAMGDMVR